MQGKARLPFSTLLARYTSNLYKIIFRSVFQVKEVLVKSNLYSNMEDALKAEVKKQNKFSIGQ